MSLPWTRPAASNDEAFDCCSRRWRVMEAVALGLALSSLVVTAMHSAHPFHRSFYLWSPVRTLPTSVNPVAGVALPRRAGSASGSLLAHNLRHRLQSDPPPTPFATITSKPLPTSTHSAPLPSKPGRWIAGVSLFSALGMWCYVRMTQRATKPRDWALLSVQVDPE